MNKTLILVVEDDRPIRNLIVTTLKTHDYKYLAAENGASAILEVFITQSGYRSSGSGPS